MKAMGERAQPAPRRCRSRVAVLRRRDQGVEMRRHDRVEDVVLGREIMVDQRFGRAARLGEIGHRRARKAAPRIELRGRGEDRLAALVVIGGLGPRHRRHLRRAARAPLAVSVACRLRRAS